MPKLAPAIAAIALLAAASPAHTATNAAGGIRIETPGRVDYLSQYPDSRAAVTFTGPVRIARHGPNTVVKMLFDGQPGQWVVVTVRPVPTAD